MNNYKIVSCVSFGNSGSGVVTDYLSEFDCIYNPGDYEFRFLHDYGGVSTLEDCLVHNYNRLNSDIAVHLYKRYVNLYGSCLFGRQYEKYFNGQWKKISMRFLDRITDVTWTGSWAGQMLLSSSVHYPIFQFKVMPRILKLLTQNKYHAKFLPKNDMYYSSPTEEYFCQCVKEYIHELCAAVTADKAAQFLYFDQLLPSTNTERYLKYFDNIKIISVDRDPRDHYIDNLINWKERWIPADVDNYIIVYKKIREKLEAEKEHSSILRLRFEDAVYHYDDFKKTVNNFLSLNESNHTRPKSKFNPDISIKNTRLWETADVDSAIIKKIENSLSDYCYTY
jgi:hypothetical protein